MQPENKLGRNVHCVIFVQMPQVVHVCLHVTMTCYTLLCVKARSISNHQGTLPKPNMTLHYTCN